MQSAGADSPFSSDGAKLLVCPIVSVFRMSPEGERGNPGCQSVFLVFAFLLKAETGPIN